MQPELPSFHTGVRSWNDLIALRRSFLHAESLTDESMSARASSHAVPSARPSRRSPESDLKSSVAPAAKLRAPCFSFVDAKAAREPLRRPFYAGPLCPAIGVTDAAIALAISSSTEKMSLTSRS